MQATTPLPLDGVEVNIETREEIKVRASEVRSDRFAFSYKQLELGRLEAFESHGDWIVVIVAEYWPSWIMAIQGDFREVKCYCKFGSLKAKAEFNATEFHKSLISRVELIRLVTTQIEKIIMLVQGSTVFYSSIYNSLELGNKDIPTVFICSDEIFFSGDSQRITHAECGGITNGEWSFHVENIPEFGIHSKPNLRRVIHQIIDPVNGEARAIKFVRSGEYPDCEPLHMNELVPWKKTQVLVNAPSVYLKGDHVIRLLSDTELMTSYDIEFTIQSQLMEYWSDHKESPTFNFISQVPVKVLGILFLSVKYSLFKNTHETCLTSSGSSSSLDTLITNNVESRVEDDDSVVGEAVISADSVARPDDAEADPEDWDLWTVNSFKMDGDRSPLVCNGNYQEHLHKRFLDAWRLLLERQYRKLVRRSFVRYLKRTYGGDWLMKSRRKKADSSLKLDIQVGRDALTRAANSTWWSWDDGSTLYFWRWPLHLKDQIRDGTPLFIDWKLMPTYKRKQQWPSDTLARSKLENKLRKVRSRRYINPGYVKSLTGFFAVPKAETDIRVVYDATKCGLNEALWSPNFWLPTIDTVLNQSDNQTWFSDLDLGEMFLNFPLDPKVRPYAGVDLTEIDNMLVSAGRFARTFERWERMLMGFRPSPYVTTQTYAWGEELIIGNYNCHTNPFFFDQVIQNLPGSKEYDPSLPWVFKWNSIDKVMPAFMETYIDDVKAGGSSEANCRRATHQIGSRLNYLGEQDAARKRSQASKVPRVWTGAKCLSREGVGLFVLAPQPKWDKAKAIITDFHEQVVEKRSTTLNHKNLERGVGFLCHLTRTYPSAFPYLKGIYNTLNSWRIGRTLDGWKMSRTAWMELLSADLAFDEDNGFSSSFESRKRKFAGQPNQLQSPVEVTPVPRLVFDLKALKELFQSKSPTLRLVRGNHVKSVIYGFADASGDGFGSSWEIKNSNGKNTIHYRYGLWGDSSEGTSSNFRELANLVETLETMAEEEDLSGKEVFLFTDNSTSEAAFYNGSSSSELLFKLVLRLRKLEMNSETKFQVCHVSGERMKIQGTDGLSRGNLTVGVMNGKDMLCFVPIHMSALKRSETLAPWLRSWLGPENLEFLSPYQWYTRGHDHVKDHWESNHDFTGENIITSPALKPGVFVWAPAPCAALAAVEQLRKARHKRQESLHIFIVPRLMTPLWRKQLHKASDLVLSIPIGHTSWPSSMYEPLTLAVIFPFLNCRPWQLRGCPKLLELGRQLSGVWRNDPGREGPLLRELRAFKKSISSLPPQLAWKVLQSMDQQPIPHCQTRKRRRSNMEGKKRRRKIFDS